MSNQHWKRRNERNMRNKVVIPSATDSELLERAETALENANKASEQFQAVGADLVVATLELDVIVRELRLRTSSKGKADKSGIKSASPPPKALQQELDIRY